MSKDRQRRSEQHQANGSPRVTQRQVAPGKVTRTAALTARRAGSLQRKERQGVPAAPAQRMPAGAGTQADAQVEDWSLVAVRPDLHQAPIMRQRSDVGYAHVDAPRSGAGSAMPAEVQARMEQSFGADFSAVRIHEGSHVSGLGALAYTRGADIHFAPGQYQPSSPRGQELLGHELTHVVQQAQGRVSSTAQAKGVALNDDPALEHEADVMGARAARGEPVQGAPARPGVAAADAVVQCYTDVTLRGQPWRLSDSQSILVKGMTESERPKELYAAGELVEAANTRLEQAGSFVRLDGQSTHPIKVRGDRVAFEGDIQEAAFYVGSGKENAGHRSAQEMESDYYEGQDQVLGPASGLDVARTLTKVMPRYVGPTEGGVYAELSGKIEGTGRMHTTADCNRTARIIMGVLDQPSVEQAEVSVTSRGGEQVVHAQRESPNLGKETGEATLVERGGLTGLKSSLLAYREIVTTRPIYTTHQAGVDWFLQQPFTAQSNAGIAWRRLYDLKQQQPSVYSDFVSWSGIDARARPEVGDALVTYRPDGLVADKITYSPRIYQAMVAALQEQMHLDEQQARDTLTGFEITETSLYAEIVRKLRELAEMESPASPVLDSAMSDNDLWNKHWGGVVMTDGDDYVTLENDASTYDASEGEANDKWLFALYGSAKPGQSFHEQMMATGDFGVFASTMRFRKPPEE